MFRDIKIDAKSKSGHRVNRAAIRTDPKYNIRDERSTVVIDPAKVDIEWYSTSSKKSKRLDKEFTNFIEDFITHPQVDKIIETLNGDLNKLLLIKHDPVDISNSPKGERIKDIIELYFDFEIPEHEYWFVKIDIRTDFQESVNLSGPARIVMVNAKDMESNKHFLQILFVDPYHLFIPSKHKGKPAERMKKETYERCEDFNVCLSQELE